MGIMGMGRLGVILAFVLKNDLVAPCPDVPVSHYGAWVRLRWREQLHQEDLAVRQRFRSWRFWLLESVQHLADGRVAPETAIPIRGSAQLGCGKARRQAAASQHMAWGDCSLETVERCHLVRPEID